MSRSSGRQVYGLKSIPFMMIFQLLRVCQGSGESMNWFPCMEDGATVFHHRRGMTFISREVATLI